MIVGFLIVYGLGVAAILSIWFFGVLPLVSGSIWLIVLSLVICFLVAAGWSWLAIAAYEGKDSGTDQK